MVHSRYQSLFLELLFFGHFCSSLCDDRLNGVNQTANYRINFAEDKAWCPPSREILPCICTGPQTFPLVTCNHIVDAYTIQRISEAFHTLPRIGKFSLTNSRITTLGPTDLGFLECEYIHARKNTITHISQGFFNSSRKSLIRIELTHNDLESFNFRDIADFPKLENIDLKYNSIKSIPHEAFGHFINYKLKKLDLSFNKITHVGSNAFKYLCNLELLDLRYNKLTVLNNLAFSAYALNPGLTLNLAHNKIIFISNDAFNNQIFKCLNLTENNLWKFPYDIFHKVIEEMTRHHTGIILVKNNRFRCTCENVEWIVRLPDAAKSHVADLDCADKNDRNIKDLNLQDIDCQH